MDKLLSNELFVRLLSVALALLIYVQVVSQPGGITQRAIPQVPVQAAGVPADLVVQHILPGQVTVTVRGAAQAIQQLPAKDVQAVVDLQQAVPGRRDYYVQVTVPRGVQQVSVTPLQVVVVVDQLIDQSMSVVAQTTGRLPAGFAAGQAAVSPGTVVVHGPARTVAEVARVVATIDLSGVKDTVSRNVAPVPVDARGRPVAGLQVLPATVSVSLPVARVVPTKTVPVVATLSGVPAAGYAAGRPQASPATVTVLGPASVLDRVQRVHTVAVPVTGATSSVVAAALVVDPPGALAVDPSSVEVRVPVARGAATKAG